MKKYHGLVLLLAWVLWTRTQSPTNDSWTALTGFPTQERCAANLKEKLDVWRQFKDAKFGDNSVTFTDNKTTATYICLTDTEDPRQKGKPSREGL
ncbi:MAG: hypothetical protein ACREO5_05110 [Candidatus Binatia bacterium]